MHQITDENFTIVDGKSYTVIWDGEAYQCVAITVDNIPILGNSSIAGAGADTGEPFLFMDYGNDQKLIVTNSTAATHTITVSDEIVYPITSEFLPDSVKNAMSLIVINAQMPSSASWSSITYGNGKFVAVSVDSAKAAYSEDGINWKTTFEYLSQNNSNITEDVRSVIGIPSYSTANNGQFLRVIDGTPTWTESLPTLTSPNGTKYQLTVSDDGTLSAVAQS